MNENFTLLLSIAVLIILGWVLITSYQENQSFSKEFCENKEEIWITNQWAISKPEYIICGIPKGEGLIKIEYTNIHNNYYQLLSNSGESDK